MNLYAPVHIRLCRYVQAMVWNREDAEDMISEITLVAFEKFDTIQNKEQFPNYLFGIARNLFFKKLRRKKFATTLGEQELLNLPGDLGADDRMKQIELAKLLAGLTNEQRDAITLYEVAGFSYDEIAAIMQISLSKVKAIIFRGRQRLKDMIIMENERLMRFQNASDTTKLNMNNLI